MKKLNNGWHIPDDEIKMTMHVEKDIDIFNPGYESRHRETILKNIPIRKTFVDVGANIGIWSAAMSKHFDNVISFEPSKRNRECLEINLKNISDIRPYAVGNKQGKANFHDAIKNCGDSKITFDNRAGMYSVDVVTLDDQNIKDCSLIKIDVQGFELGVIEGAKNIIEKQQPWIIFEINEDVDKIVDFLEKRNYEMILNKSKRVMIWAPKDGVNKPLDSEAFGRRMGPGPYAPMIRPKPDIKQPWHD